MIRILHCELSSFSLRFLSPLLNTTCNTPRLNKKYLLLLSLQKKIGQKKRKSNRMVRKRQIQELKRKCTYGFCALLFYYIGFRSEFTRIFRNQNIIKLKHQKYKENSENISSLRSSAISTKCSKNHLFCVRHKEYEIKTNFHIMKKLPI